MRSLHISAIRDVTEPRVCVRVWACPGVSALQQQVGLLALRRSVGLSVYRCCSSSSMAPPPPLLLLLLTLAGKTLSPRSQSVRSGPVPDPPLPHPQARPGPRTCCRTARWTRCWVGTSP